MASPGISCIVIIPMQNFEKMLIQLLIQVYEIVKLTLVEKNI